ncbi:hypothetical protein P9112_000147 [Eukaryota sp. TZLM1-RC]
MHFQLCGDTDLPVLNQVLTPILGEKGFSLNTEKSTLDVHVKIELDILQELVKSAGFELVVSDPSELHSLCKKVFRRSRPPAVLFAIIPFFIDAFVLRSFAEALEHSKGAHFLVIVSYLISLTFSIISFSKELLDSALHLRMDLNTLVTAAVVGALALEEYLDSTLTALVFSFSLVLEEISIHRTRSRVTKLLDLLPKNAHLVGELVPLPKSLSRIKFEKFNSRPNQSFELRRASTTDLRALHRRSSLTKIPEVPESDEDKEEEVEVLINNSYSDDDPIEVPVGCLSKGAVVLVYPGDVIPVDGVIIEGETSVNEAILSGDATLYRKSVNDEVIGGTLNVDSEIKVRVTSMSSEATLSKLIHFVIDHSEQRSTRGAWLYHFAKKYTPFVFALGVVVAVVPALFHIPFMDLSFRESIMRGLLIIIVACPWSIVLSVPLAVYSATSVASLNGVLINSGRTFETGALVKGVIFDKNGSLTSQNSLRVEHVASFCDDFSPNDILQLSASIESQSKHKFATSLVSEAQRRGLDLFKLLDADIDSIGCSGQLDVSTNPKFEGLQGKHFWSGGLPIARSMVDTNLYPTEHAKVVSIAKDFGRDEISCVIVGIDDKPIGIIGLYDAIREDAFSTVRELHRNHYKTFILSADTSSDVEKVSKALNISTWYGELSVDQKLAKMNQIRNEVGRVATLGDCVFDSALLVQSDLGVAMNSGTDVAKFAGDVTLTYDKLKVLPWFLHLCKRTVNIMRFNVYGSIIFKIVKLGMVALKGGTLVSVMVFDLIATLVVVINSYRLAWSRSPFGRSCGPCCV